MNRFVVITGANAISVKPTPHIRLLSSPTSVTPRIASRALPDCLNNISIITRRFQHHCGIHGAYDVNMHDELLDGVNTLICMINLSDQIHDVESHSDTALVIVRIMQIVQRDHLSHVCS